MANCVDLTGQKFGRLIVLKRVKPIDGKGRWYLCECECGNTKEVRGYCLTNGSTRSCGCLSSELTSVRNRRLMTKHGWYGTRLYGIWNNIRDRCENTRNIQYKNYGGRGIKMCEQWRNNPALFCEWAVENGYSDKLWIDRIDNDGNYKPTNCRWTTRSEQQTNKRNNIRITYNGETLCLAEWARKLGIKASTVYTRHKRGWTKPEELLFGR